MTDAPAPVPSTTTSAPSTAPAAPSPAPEPTPVAVARPEYLPEAYWDPQANTIKPEFGQHYSELKTFQESEVARKAALPQKPEDYKLEAKIPEGVTLPPGMEIKFDPKDPETASLLAFAHESGLSQAQVDRYVENDIRVKVERHNADVAQIAEEDKALGANASARKDATGNYIKGMKDRGEITPAIYERAKVYATDALTVQFLEALIAKANGSVPGSLGNDSPPKPAEVPMKDRWYGSTPQKAS